MNVKVKYELTTAREATIHINDDEFLEWYNQAFDPDDQATSIHDVEDLDDQLQEYLEDQDSSVWAVGPDHDPMAEVYDQELVKVERQ